MKLILIFLIISLSNPGKIVEIPPAEAKKHIGEKVKVCGKVIDAKFGETAAKHILISMGGSFPNQPLTIIISLEDRKNFSYKPENYLRNKNVCISGKVIERDGRTELILTRPEDIMMDDEESDIEIKANYFDFFNKYFDDK